MRSVVTITKDIGRSDYVALIETACERYPEFSVVWREQLHFDPSAQALQHELRRFQVSRSRTDHWPGTRIVGSRGDVIRYTSRAAATGVLVRPRSLFGWLAPRFPEDLCFYADDGSCAIISVSHERGAWFCNHEWLRLLPKSADPEIERLSDESLHLLQPMA